MTESPTDETPSEEEDLPVVSTAPDVAFVVPAPAYLAIDTEEERTRPPDPAPPAISAPPIDLGPALKGIEALDAKLDALRTLFDREIRAENTREKVVDRLHAELQEYKQDLLLGVLRPVFVDLIQLHDDVGKMADSLLGEADRAGGMLRGIQQGIEDILYRQGVEPFSLDGEQFDARRQRAITTVATDDPARAGPSPGGSARGSPRARRRSGRRSSRSSRSRSRPRAPDRPAEPARRRRTLPRLPDRYGNCSRLKSSPFRLQIGAETQTTGTSRPTIGHEIEPLPLPWLAPDASDSDSASFAGAPPSRPNRIGRSIMPRALPGPSDLASTIASRILARTHGQVRELKVELGDHGVVIRGRAPTYYAKQLALHGAMDLIQDHAILNQIEVG